MDIDRLKNAELIESKRELPEVELMFKHPLIQQATYATLLEDRRRHLHTDVHRGRERHDQRHQPPDGRPWRLWDGGHRGAVNRLSLRAVE